MSGDPAFDTGDWSQDENRATVEAYFAMLAPDILGKPYNKAENRRALMRFVARPEKAIEFKHQNVSAVLLGLGHPWIVGYKPARNFQLSLVDAVIEFLRRHPGWFDPIDRVAVAQPQPCANRRRCGLDRHRRSRTNRRPSISLK